MEVRLVFDKWINEKGEEVKPYTDLDMSDFHSGTNRCIRRRSIERST